MDNTLPANDAKKEQNMNVHEGYVVFVWFAVARNPQAIGTFATLAAAEREARAYKSDSKGIWIEHPDGSREVVR